MKQMIFAGSSNLPLAKELAHETKMELGRVELTAFPNGERRVIVREEKIGTKAVVVQSLSFPPDEMIVELALLSDALKRMGVVELVGVVPWLGYAKQDKVFRPGEPLSVKVVAKLLQVAGFSRVITIDLHNPSVVGFFDIPVTELSAKPLFVDYFGKSVDKEKTLVVAPDAGAVKASTEFANELGVQVVYLDKKRDLVTGEVKVMGMTGEVKGKEILIMDDNVVTGSTLIKTAKVLKDAGASLVRIGVTHHMYVPGTQKKIEACREIDELVVTNTVCRPESDKGEVRILSVAKLLAEALI